MKNFSYYKKAGYVGCDVNLKTSLYEYGLIWKEYKRSTKAGFKKGEYRFVYSVGFNGEKFSSFDWGALRADVNPLEEWNWADFEKVSEFSSLTLKEFLAQPLPFIVDSLLAYYGHENVFGGSYYPFEIRTR